SPDGRRSLPSSSRSSTGPRRSAPRSSPRSPRPRTARRGGSRSRRAPLRSPGWRDASSIRPPPPTGAPRFRARPGPSPGPAAPPGLAPLPPRAVGSGEPRVNARAAADLEEQALACDADEHRQALLHAAVRWIDEAGRDLGAVAREGNFRKVFPFGAEIAGEAE